MIKGAVFDMDGLMFDSEKLTFDAWYKVLNDNGFCYTFDIYKQTVGKRTVETKAYYESLYGDSFDYSSMRQKANDVFWDYIEKNGMPIKKGLFELLDYLKANNIKISLATSTSEESAMRMIKKAGVEEYFDAFVCGNMVKNGKPHPEVFLTAAEKLSLPPQSCIALEDSINGIKSAYAAKMKTVMVPDYLQPTEDVLPMISFLCSDLSEAVNYISGL